jgi:hypothetical protein
MGWLSLLPLFIAIRVLRPLLALACGALWRGCLFAFCVAADRTAVSGNLASLTLLTAIPAIYTFLGALPWCLTLTLIGVWVGDNWETWEGRLKYFDYVVGAILVGLVCDGCRYEWNITRTMKDGRQTFQAVDRSFGSVTRLP